MAEASRCSECQAELTPEASPGGLCPQCLLKLGLPDSGETPSTKHIGPYRLLQKLGEGGMGEVWEAEQLTPLRRRVALKLIKGLETDEVVARFEIERQALALMNHPNIAKVLDAGATEEGRPYFVMEYVPGVPITRYCDSQRLTTGERIDLFLSVCDGVQHAHQRGIIHRDLKPSNVLVEVRDGQPIAKIIDFGVAKATQQRLTERTMFTDFGVLTGTPAYMSPEQAGMSGFDVDTRTDVYSLGMLLYELLVGAPPFDAKELRAAGFDEMRRRIREEEPSRPSERISTLGGGSKQSAELRRTDSATLVRLLRGDLDWITLRALEKDRTRRYGSPSDLAADIDRHLKHEPVLAGPPSVSYRARKFVRRHRLAVSAAATVLAALVVGLGAATYGLVEARRANEIAREEAATAEQVSEFLIGLFKVSAPSEARGNTITAREMLDRGVEQIDDGLKDQPRVRQRLRHTMGQVHLLLGLYRDGTELLELTLQEQRELLGDQHDRTLTTLMDLGWAYLLQNRGADSERMFREVYETGTRVLGRDHETTLRAMAFLGNLYRAEARYEEAEPLLKGSLESLRKVLGEDHAMTNGAMTNLAMLYTAQERYEEAEVLYLEGVGLARKNQGDDHPQTLNRMTGLFWLYREQGRYDDAESLGVEALTAQRRVAGEDHPDTLQWKYFLGELYWMQGRLDEAELLLLDGLERSRERLGEDHSTTLGILIAVAETRREQGRYEEAASLAREALERYRRHTEENHPVIQYAAGVLAGIEEQRVRRESD